MLLTIDTSTRYAGVALSDGVHILNTRSWHSSSSHTSELMPAVKGVLGERGITPRDLDGITVALGPGAFSALRVGISAAKGLALAAGKPLAGIPTLDLEAYPFLGCGLPVCALLEAGRNEVAAAFFDPEGERTAEDTMGPPGEVLSGIGQPTIFCGEGISRWRASVEDRLGTLAIIVQPAAGGRLSSLAELGRIRLNAGEADNLAILQPHYLRMPSIGGPKRRDRTPQRS